MINFNHAWYFDRVAAEGSIARAAQSLSVAPSTISEQLREFERTLGVTLFDRSASGLTLTETGRRLREHTREMFRVAERLLRALPDQEPDVRSFRVGVAASVSRGVTAGLLLPLMTMESCVPNVRTGEITELVRGLRGGDLDLVLTETSLPESALQTLRSVDIHRVRLVAVAAPERAPAGAEVDWRRTPLIHYRAESAYRWEVDEWLEARGARPPVAAETDDCGLMLEAAARGAGLAFLPHSVTRDAIRLGRVRALATFDSAVTLRALVRDREQIELAERAIERLRSNAEAIYADRASS